MKRRYLNGLNPEQRQAVEHGTSLCAAEPLLVIAGAGSGKTSTLAHTVAHFIVNGADPQRILLLTFSRRAAHEMKHRVQSIVSQATGQPGTLGWVGTFHSVGARLLRLYADYIDLDRAFTILDRPDSEDLLNRIRRELDFARTDMRFPKKSICMSIYSRVINAEQPLIEVLDEAFPYCTVWSEELCQLFSAFVQAKQAQRLLDYDDLLLYWSRMMQVPDLAADVSARFDHVLVDEYQDTNRLQSSIICRMRPDGRGVTVVGDDAQSIYGFRAATVRNILDFPDLFQPRARVLTLERNYRSTQPILEASNAVIALASERYSKDLWSDRKSDRKPLLVSVPDGMEQARYVAEQVLENQEQGVPLKSQAVLFRAGHHSIMLELELGRRNIPFRKFGGLRFVDTAHIKDFLAPLRWSLNPRDTVAAHRALQLMPGVGSASASRLAAKASNGPALLGTLAAFRAPAASAPYWPSFVALMQRLCVSLGDWPQELEAVRSWYDPLIDLIHDNPLARRADLDQLMQIVGTFPTRERFLTDLTLDPPSAASDEAGELSRDDEYLTLSTIHSAKGLEWTSVFILSCVDGCIPSDLGAGSREDLEEERRLLYVAMTRAKDDLRLMLPHRLRTGGQLDRGDQSVTVTRSRFIPPELLVHFDQVSWPSAGQTMDDHLRLGEAYDVGAVGALFKQRPLRPFEPQGGRR